jgi:hypothetical protein
MSATKRQVNWANCSYASNVITGVTNATVDQGGQLLTFKGDTDLYDTLIIAVTIEPTVSITAADVGMLLGFTCGQVGLLNLTHKDAKGGAGGDVVFTVVSAVFESASDSGAHAQVGVGTASWKCLSSDGQAPALTFARA